MSPLILLVEDDAALAVMLRYNLEREGYRVAEASSGAEALARFDEEPPDLVLLDWMLPVLSGLEVCRQLRRRPGGARLPVIMLTARGEEADAVRALDTGADDYITKPFGVAALLARIRAALRRADPAEAGALGFADIAMDLSARRVLRSGRAVSLGPTEFRLLEYLLRHPRRVFSREALLDAVWGRDLHVEPRTVDVHIRRLRQALNGPGEPDPIRTVRSAGYALDEAG